MQWCDRMLLNGQSQINHAHHWERQKKTIRWTKWEIVFLSLFDTLAQSKAGGSYGACLHVVMTIFFPFFMKRHSQMEAHDHRRLIFPVWFLVLVFLYCCPLILPFWGVDRMYGAVNWHHFLCIWRPLATPFNKFADSLICHHSRSDDEWTIDKEGVSVCVCKSDKQLVTYA